MARFHYSMQSILDIKLKLEDQAKQEFANAKATLDQEEERLGNLIRRREGYERRAKELLAGTLILMDIEENKTAILNMDIFIKEQRVRVAAAERVLEQAREKLTEVMKERKTHENLKEKAFEQFLADENRREGKEIDELTSYVYGQRIKENKKEESYGI